MYLAEAANINITVPNMIHMIPFIPSAKTCGDESTSHSGETPNHSRVPCYGLSGLMHTDWRCSTSLPCLLQGPLGREAPTCIQQKCHPRNTMESETCEPTKERHSSSPNAARQLMLDPPWPLCHPPFSLNGTITSTPLCFKTPLNQKWFVAWLVPWARSHPRPTE